MTCFLMATEKSPEILCARATCAVHNDHLDATRTRLIMIRQAEDDT